MSLLVSIIIPFYNEEQYLERAVTSALVQTYSPTEIILVNDGSTDNSLHIANDFKNKYENIKLISTSHVGLGHARNAGVAIATGYYLTFLDSDDVLSKNAVTALVKNINTYQSDIVAGKFKGLDEIQGQMNGWGLDGKPQTGIEAALEMFHNQIAHVAWAKLYKTEIAKQILFPDNLWFEDRPYLLKYFFRSNIISFEEECIIQAQSRPSSITRRLMSKKRIKDITEVYFLDLETVKGHPREKEFVTIIDKHQVSRFMENLIILCMDKDKIDNLKELQDSFILNLKDFKKQLRKHGSLLGKRDHLDLLFMQLCKLISWEVVFLLLPFYKRRKYTTIQKIRTPGSL
jgi:glycosyltransferase involved in cell wall biosynthesis